MDSKEERTNKINVGWLLVVPALLVYLWWKEWLDYILIAIGALLCLYVLFRLWLAGRQHLAKTREIENLAKQTGVMVVQGKGGETWLHDLSEQMTNALHLQMSQYTNGKRVDATKQEIQAWGGWHSRNRSGKVIEGQLLGPGEVSEPLEPVLDLLPESYHILLVGPTAAGKTDLAMYLHDECKRVYPGALVTVADPHAQFNDWREGVSVYQGMGSCAAVWYEMIKLIQGRYETGVDSPTVMVILDELPTQMGELKEAGFPVSKWFRRVARDGRKAGVIFVGLTTGKGVKDLQQDGFGSIRQSFMQFYINNTDQTIVDVEFSNGDKKIYSSPGPYRSGAGIIPKDQIPRLKPPTLMQVQQLDANELQIESGIEGAEAISDSHVADYPAVGGTKKCELLDCETVWVVTTMNQKKKKYCCTKHRVAGNRAEAVTV